MLGGSNVFNFLNNGRVLLRDSLKTYGTDHFRLMRPVLDPDVLDNFKKIAAKCAMQQPHPTLASHHAGAFAQVKKGNW